MLMPFAESRSSSGLLLELIHDLVELSSTTDGVASRASAPGGSIDDTVAVQAARCLGLIGCVDVALVTHRGRPANTELHSAVSAMRDAPQMQQYCHMFHALADCLTNPQSVAHSLSLLLLFCSQKTCHFCYSVTQV